MLVRWKDLDFDAEVPTLSVGGKLVRVKEAKPGLQSEDFVKSGMSTWAIPLPVDTADMLRARFRSLAERKLRRNATDAEKTFVFSSSTRSIPAPDNVNKRVRRVFDAAELPTATNHTLRRTVENRLNRSTLSGSWAIHRPSRTLRTGTVVRSPPEGSMVSKANRLRKLSRLRNFEANATAIYVRRIAEV